MMQNQADNVNRIILTFQDTCGSAQETDGSCYMEREQDKRVKRFVRETPKKRFHSESVRVYGKITLIYILEIRMEGCRLDLSGSR
jgi:hypothetical protein